MELLKSMQDFPQNLSPDVLWPIQDPPKRPPRDLINLPEGTLWGRWGAKPASRDPPWTSLGAPLELTVENTTFFEKT